MSRYHAVAPIAVLLGSLMLSLFSPAAAGGELDSWLMIDTCGGHIQTVRECLSDGADPNARAETGFTYLHGAALNGHGDIVRLLLTRGAGVSPELKDARPFYVPISVGGDPATFTIHADGCSRGDTPLHMAANPAVAKALLSHGADPSLKNSEGKTPVQTVRERYGYDLSALVPADGPPELKGEVDDHGTYRSKWGAELVEMSPAPGTEMELKEVTIAAKVRFPAPATSDKEFIVYRDGKAVLASRQTKRKGTREYLYRWTDGDVPGGKHEYVLCLPGLLVTSPTHVTVVGSSSSTPGKVAWVQGENVWIMNVDGSQHRRLTTTSDCWEVSLSPDETKLVYTRGPFMRLDLWIYDFTAGAAAKLTRQRSAYEHPRWAPNGRQIACFAQDDSVPESEWTDYIPGRLLLTDPATGQPRILRNGIRGPMDLAWSPNSALLAYAHGTEGEAAISVVRSADGALLMKNLHVFKGSGPEASIGKLTWGAEGEIRFTEYERRDAEGRTRETRRSVRLR